MKRRVIGIVLVIAFVVGGGFVATQSFAHSWGGPGQHMHGSRGFGGMFKRLFRQLDLTDEQKGKARDIMIAARKTGIQMHADLKVARLELHEQLMQDEVDQAAVEQHLNQVGQLQQKWLRHRVETRLKLREMLTPEQRAKARTVMMERMMDGPSHSFHERGGHGRGGHGRGEGRGHR